MNIETATMNPPYREASIAYDAYRKLVKQTPTKASADDVTLYRALGQVIKGRKVIDITLAIQSVGVDDNGRPKLAIGRADWKHVHVWRLDGRYVFSARTEPWSWRGRRVFKSEVAVRIQGSNGADVKGRAITPIIPAQYRPKGALSGYHILWEAEWERVPPVDPILLKHIGGPFFSVLAVWDLSPLEQAVLRHKL